MLSETPVSIKICFGPELVFTRSAISGTNSECISRTSLSSLTFHSSLISFALDVVKVFSSSCQFVRWEFLPSVSQSAAKATTQIWVTASMVEKRGIAYLQFLQPNVPNGDLAGTFNLEPDQTVFSELGWVVIDQDRHNVTVHD